ncbi:galactose-1-epimerase [Vibrio methylphosphonaticus]|uniref:galactose-1-epimerase n=1 Tax=Vibrio methylphosphonaticus TaxID=2946866 RepID=UPI00202A5D8D|nr:galactose-1-epimerase [Vibrio methylphosphonaticus]MCL9773294.1 galactose-1-epimerase [Vibrio methylphosphonaticus]
MTNNNERLSTIEDSMTQDVSFDGLPAKVFHLSNAAGMTASFMDIGATWLSCSLPLSGEQREVLLRSPNMAEHMRQGAYFGSVVGRYANRIDKGQFEIGGKSYQVTCNNGENALHGGVEGFDKRRWSIDSHTESTLVFSLESKDGDQGFPGNASIQVTYHLGDNNELSIRYQASCDQTTAMNLTNHAYFNLSGESSSAKSIDHKLKMFANAYLPTREDLIPLGELKSVNATSFDFREEKIVGRDFLADKDQQIAGGYDHTFIFDAELTNGQAVVSTLVSPQHDVTMDVLTTKPSMQLYTGNFLGNAPGVSQNYANLHGIALETQYFPDGPNHPEWGRDNGILNVGESYQQSTTYRFHF